MPVLRYWHKRFSIYINSTIEIGEERDMLMDQLKELQQSFDEFGVKSDKGAKTFQLPYKDLKLAQSERKPADNLT